MGRYAAAIGDSWKQQTLLNIVKLRYGDFPVFVEIAQVIAGYQLQTTVAAGFSAQNYINTAVGGPAAFGGSAGVGATYIDRPTVIYTPLTGNDFIEKLMSPVPPSAVLFLLQSGYSAAGVLPLTVDSINAITNESRRPGMTRPADPQFARLTQLLLELQQANALVLDRRHRRAVQADLRRGHAAVLDLRGRRQIGAARRHGAGQLIGLAQLLQLDTHALDEGLPAVDLGADRGHEGVGRAAGRNRAVGSQAVGDLRALEPASSSRLVGDVLGTDSCRATG